MCLSPTLLTLTGAIPEYLSLEKNQLRALVDKSLGHERNISIQTPSVGILASLAGLCTLAATHMIVHSLPTVRGMGSLKI